jgi:hypothetical protein
MTLADLKEFKKQMGMIGGVTRIVIRPEDLAEMQAEEFDAEDWGHPGPMTFEQLAIAEALVFQPSETIHAGTMMAVIPGGIVKEYSTA